MYNVRTQANSWKPPPGVDFTPYQHSFDAMFVALASPVRRRILNCIGNGTTSTTMLAEFSGVRPSTVCHHIKVLEKAALIDRCPSHVCIRLNRNALKALRDYMQHYF